MTFKKITTYTCHRHETQPYFLLAYGFMLILNPSSGCFDSSVPSCVSSSVCCLFFMVCVCSYTPPVTPFREFISEIVLPYKSFSWPGFGNLSEQWAELLSISFHCLSREKDFGWVSSGRGWGSSAYLLTFCFPLRHCPNTYPKSSTVPPENRYNFSLNQRGAHGGSSKVFTTAGTNALL